jgi:hypothetical protein
VPGLFLARHKSIGAPGLFLARHKSIGAPGLFLARRRPLGAAGLRASLPAPPCFRLPCRILIAFARAGS